MARDQTPAVSEHDAVPPFLEADPPHWVARGIASLMIVLFVVGAGASVIIHLPDTVSSPFVLVPTRGADPVRAPRDGIVAEVRVVEGQSVPQGMPLFVIHSQAVGERSATLQTFETHLRGVEERLIHERQRYESQRLADDEEGDRLRGRLAYLTEKIDKHRGIQAIQQGKYRASQRIHDSEIDSTKRAIVFKRHHLTLAKELAQGFERLYQKDIASKLEYQSRQLEVDKIALELQHLEAQLEVTRLKMDQLRAEYDHQELEWKLTMDQLQTERQEVHAALDKLLYEAEARQTAHRELERQLREDMDKTALRIEALKQDLGHSRGHELLIPAPCTGTVLRLHVKGPDAVVRDGDTLCALACDGEHLQAELTVSQAGVGRLTPGQGVKLLYEAFPYQRYGVKHGIVRWISPASVPMEDGAAFRAFVALEDDAMHVDGQRRPLMAGMRGRAEVVVGKRSLLSYAFEPIRQLKEHLADAPGRASMPHDRENADHAATR
ncbi:MAG TPA: HlyD family efflux transporter periplasmic adaptor subunit [Alphaproteobacteria bacterium]|nr:HlyD family efflux transporter periplasmic adaptor subunit [Alphaproteobacteria bacterium]